MVCCFGCLRGPEGHFKEDIDTDVEVEVEVGADIDRHFGCL